MEQQVEDERPHDSQPSDGNTSPMFILVPGHWHTKAHMNPLIHALEQQSHQAKTVQLHSVGRKSPQPTFQDEVHTIYLTICEALQAGKDVCLVLHSYAGMPGAEALNRLIADEKVLPTGDGQRRGTLVRAIFIAAYTFPSGIVMDAKEFIGPGNPGLSIDEKDITYMANPAHYFFNDLSVEAAQPWVDALDDAYYLGRGPVISSEDWRKLPITALLCKRDNAIPPERQEMVWQGVEHEWIDAAHTPYVSQPEKMAEILVRLART